MAECDVCWRDRGKRRARCPLCGQLVCAPCMIKLEDGFGSTYKFCDDCNDQVFDTGKNAGDSAAINMDRLEIGQRVPTFVDWVGYRIVTQENEAGVFDMLAHECESGARCYAGWEDVANHINDLVDPDTAWEVYDLGVNTGVTEVWQEIQS